MKYGRQISYSLTGMLATSEVVNVIDGKEVGKFQDNIERIPVQSIMEMHAEWLKMLDLYTKGEIKTIGVQLIERAGKPQFLDKYWTVYEEIKEVE